MYFDWKNVTPLFKGRRKNVIKSRLYETSQRVSKHVTSITVFLIIGLLTNTKMAVVA